MSKYRIIVWGFGTYPGEMRYSVEERCLWFFWKKPQGLQRWYRDEGVARDALEKLIFARKQERAIYISGC